MDGVAQQRHQLMIRLRHKTYGWKLRHGNASRGKPPPCNGDCTWNIGMVVLALGAHMPLRVNDLAKIQRNWELVGT